MTVDVVVPTSGRPSLADLVLALAAARGPRPDRVIVVDDRRGPRGPLPLPAVPGLDVRVLPGPGRGPAAARNEGWRAAAQSFVHAATRSGLVLFIVSAAQALAFVLTLQQVPHAVAEMLVSLSGSHGTWLFLLLSIAILIVMGSVLEGAAALIIFGPLLMPVAMQLGVDPLHFGVVLVFGMGIGLFAPPLGLGLYGACLIGKVPIEQTIKPIMGYLGLLLLCLLVIAFVPGISTALPRAFGY